ncbi:MAG TPA: tetratricopeptide repeat protein [Pyrinomonadaceae bacterium]|jgi:tetratricopeptide (TPR) repeat protein
MNHMRAFASLLSLMCAAVLLCGACGKSAPSGANGNGGANVAAAPDNVNRGAAGNNSSGQELDTSKLDAEIAGLEQQAEKNPDDDATLGALAEAHVKRGHALHEARRLTDALHDYQTALRYSPDHEEASLRVAQITQEIGAEPHAEDGKPVAVPAKPGANENQ